MLARDSLKNLLHQSNLTKTDRILFCLAVEAQKPKTLKEIKEIAERSGLRSIQQWNVSTLLSGSKGKAIRTQTGWELTSAGKDHVGKLAGKLVGSPIPKISFTLRSHLSQIKHKQTAAFVDEAIRCFEAKLYRAAVVLSWVGAVSVLYDHVIKNRLFDFNAEAKRRNSKWKDAKIRDDLTRMKEWDFLDILEAISVFGKSVKQELLACLTLRNGCGHPSSLKIGEHRVSAHIESLILNVFSRFSI